MDLNLPVRWVFAVVAAWTLCLPGKAFCDDDQPLRAYFVGNSVTDTIRYGGLAKLAASRGRTLTWGRDMIPWRSALLALGAPEGRLSGGTVRALSRGRWRNTRWDVLSLQPFDRHLDGKDGDLAMARNFIDLALKRSPDVQVYVYSRWPRRDQAKDGSLTLDYKAKWLRKYTGAGTGPRRPGTTSRRLVAGLREAYEGRAKPVLMVPVGDVLLELDGRMRAGKVPGYTDIAQVYVDGIHFNNVGSYVVGTTFYATLFRDDPRGLTAEPYNEKLDPQKDRRIDEKLATAIQEAVWEVVSRHPLGGGQHRSCTSIAEVRDGKTKRTVEYPPGKEDEPPYPPRSRPR